MADRNPGTAREYVESYVKDQDLDSFLSEAQPQYDPTKKAHGNASPQQRSEESTESENKTSLPLGYNRHRPTMNPMATGEEQQENKKEKKEEEIPQRPKIMWVVRDFMDQKREIHEKAIDNCADLHVDLLTCFKDGSWWDKAKMCEHQKQKFWKCYQSQKVRLNHPRAIDRILT